MEIAQAQKDVRETFLGGFAGQLVSGVLWGASAAVCTWHSFLLGELVLLLGGFFIFPLTLLLLRSMGNPPGLPKGHPMNALGMQVAFTLPLTFPLVLAIATFHPAWFYPALMITLGAHYLPFIFMYGMWQFGVLAAALIACGVLIGRFVPAPVSLGAWVTAALLLGFAFVGRRTSAARSSQFRARTTKRGNSSATTSAMRLGVSSCARSRSSRRRLSRASVEPMGTF